MSFLCHSLGLHRYLQLAKSSTGGISQSIAADLFEAYVGALYLDTKARGHPEILQEWLEKVWSPDVFPGLERRGQARDTARENAGQAKQVASSISNDRHAGLQASNVRLEQNSLKKRKTTTSKQRKAAKWKRKMAILKEKKRAKRQRGPTDGTNQQARVSQTIR